VQRDHTPTTGTPPPVFSIHARLLTRRESGLSLPGTLLRDWSDALSRREVEAARQQAKDLLGKEGDDG
jgi:hypothetical protein